MSDELVFVFERAINMRGRPCPSMEVHGKIANRTDTPYAVLQVAAEVSVGGTGVYLPVLRVRWLTDRPLAPRDELRSVSFRVGLPLQAVAFIEERRNGGAGVLFQVEPELLVVPISKTDERVPRTMQCGVEGGEPGSFKSIAVARDQWLQMLKVFGWDDIEVFELHAAALKPIPPLSKSLEHLRQAMDQFRLGNWRQCLEGTRFAFESVAKEAGATDDTREGFLELRRRMFGEADDKKSEAFDAMVKGLNPFQQIGRHASNPYVEILREDALMGLRMTLNLLDYVSVRLGRRATS